MDSVQGADGKGGSSEETSGIDSASGSSVPTAEPTEPNEAPADSAPPVQPAALSVALITAELSEDFSDGDTWLSPSGYERTWITLSDETSDMAPPDLYPHYSRQWGDQR